MTTKNCYTVHYISQRGDDEEIIVHAVSSDEAACIAAETALEFLHVYAVSKFDYPDADSTPK